MNNRAENIGYAVLLCLGGSGCARMPAERPVTPMKPSATTIAAAMARARADSSRYPYTIADIEFMSGMIVHHSQAILMAEWAPTHDASAAIRTLAERILNEQQDEIASMQTWLSDRRQPLPRPAATEMMMMNGVEHEMRMPGMLTEPQLTRLQSSSGTQFNRLFLTFMIQHHRGALAMVKKLLSSSGAVQDQTVFKTASDINADQTSEVARMQQMLDAM